MVHWNVKRLRFVDRVYKFIGHPWFFYGTLILFALQSLWLVVVSKIPQAYDVSYHVGIIEYYAHQWSPFITHQPPSTYSYGDIVHYPSYLYHYLMSFPYWFVNLFTNNVDTIVRWMSLINIGFYVLGVWVYKKVLQFTKASNVLINFSLLIFTLLPIMPYIASQINYDSLLFLGAGLSMWLTLLFIKKLGRRKFDFTTFILLVCAAALTSLVQYSFLPILLSIVIFVVWNIVIYIRNKRSVFIDEIKSSWQKTSLLKKLSLGIFLVLSLLLFSQRYVVNIIEYKTPAPDCAQTLSYNDCLNYGPWAQTRPPYAKTPSLGFVHYVGVWLHGMPVEIFTIIDPSIPDGIPGVPILIYFCYLVFLFGVILFLYYWKRLFMKNFANRFFIVTGLILAVSIFITNWSIYSRSGILQAIQGRYFLNIIPLLIIMIGMAYSAFLRRKHHRQLKALFAIAIVIAFTQGGGDITFILRADDSWYVDNPTVISISHNLNRIAHAVVIHE